VPWEGEYQRDLVAETWWDCERRTPDERSSVLGERTDVVVVGAGEIRVSRCSPPALVGPLLCPRHVCSIGSELRRSRERGQLCGPYGRRYFRRPHGSNDVSLGRNRRGSVAGIGLSFDQCSECSVSGDNAGALANSPEANALADIRLFVRGVGEDRDLRCILVYHDGGDCEMLCRHDVSTV